jgi:hypothetical protein
MERKFMGIDYCGFWKKSPWKELEESAAVLGIPIPSIHDGPQFERSIGVAVINRQKGGLTSGATLTPFGEKFTNCM